MNRVADRKAARREARKRRAELRLFNAAWGYSENFDERGDAPVLAEPGDARGRALPRGGASLELPEGLSHDEMLAELIAAALHFGLMVPRPRLRRRRRRR